MKSYSGLIFSSDIFNDDNYDDVADDDDGYDDGDCIELSVTMFTKLIILMKMMLLLTMRNLTDWWKVEMFEGWKVDGMVEG